MRTPLLAALALCVAAAAHAQSVNQTIDHDGWHIRLESNRDGSYTCAAMWPFDDHSSVGFAADTGQHTFLVVSEPEAGLTKDATYPVSFRPGAGKPRTSTGTATSTAMLVIPVADPDTDFTALAAAADVTFEFNGDSYKEPLTTPKEAIRALGRCIAGAPTHP